jgi:Nuclease-related domain
MPLDYSGMLIRAAVPHLVWFVPALVALAALKALLPRLSGWIGERRVSAKLERLFPAVRHDLILPDGRGGLTQLDHLALTPGGLLVVETKTYSGVILGQANESTWTQVIGRRRHSFQNPLRQNYAHVRALETLAPDIPIEGRVVFAGRARFPKGLPEGVCRPADLAVELATLRQGQVTPALSRAWDRELQHKEKALA